MKKQAKKQYDSFKENGELLMLFPTLQGEWSKDQEEFVEWFSQNQKILGDEGY